MLLSIILCVQLGTTIVFAEETVDSSEIAEESIADEYEPQLVGELTEKRTANEKYFLYDDKTIVAAVYPTVVHYEDEEGTLQDIDNTLAESGLYYLNSRYYNPEICRFISADSQLNDDILGNNLFTYCGNNPISRSDEDGQFWDTVLDVASLAFSIVDVAMNPDDPWAWIGLAGDVIDLIPFVTCVGEVAKGVRAGVKVADAVWDGAEGVYDVAKAFDDDIADAIEASTKADFYITPNGEAIPARLSEFENNLSKLSLQNGKYIGNDSMGPIRIRVNEIHQDKLDFHGVPSAFHTQPHFHIERRKNITSGEWIEKYTGPMEVFY